MTALSAVGYEAFRMRGTVTAQTFRQDLEAIGVERGSTLIVHSSLSVMGWVEEGAPTVVRTLIDVLGDGGTLAMPAATPQCVDVANEFDRATTPTKMGAIAETFRGWPGTLRSDHPLESVCARGASAEEITREHPLAFSEGPGSPFGELYELDARILLLGVGFNRCTALHFAETVASKRRTMTVRFPHKGAWIEVPNVADDLDTHFPIVGAEYLAARRAVVAQIGEARVLFFAMRDLVAFAREYFERMLD